MPKDPVEDDLMKAVERVRSGKDQNPFPHTCGREDLPKGMDPSTAGIHPLFRPALLNERGREMSAHVRRAFSELLAVVEIVRPQSSRERAIAITKLQEACMWLVRDATQDPANHG